MGIVITPESELGKELARWEQFPNKITDTPGNPYKYRPYPMMVYMAHKKRNGQVRCNEAAPRSIDYFTPQEFEAACLEQETFNRSCQRIVNSDDELARALNEGWRKTPPEALERFEALEQEIAAHAAETAFHAQRMTAKAKAELADANQQTHRHVTDLKPAKRRGRPKKVKAVSADADAPQTRVEED